MHFKWRIIGRWPEGLPGGKESGPYFYLFGVYVGERRTFNHYSAEIFQVFNIKADLRQVPVPFINLCDRR
jgi:hypothetical protein